MPAGRPAKPTHLKVLHGDDKKNPQRVNRSEPTPGQAAVVPPFTLTKAAQAAWDRLAPDRIDKGVLTPWDADAFALFCEALVITKSKLSSARRRPEPGAASPMAELKTAVGIVATLGGRFGWTPSDRQKLVVEEGRRDDKERLLS